MIETPRRADEVRTFGSACAALSTRLASYKLEVSPAISPNDTMYVGDRNHYFLVGYSAVAAIATAMGLSGHMEPRRVLDLPCGHGRVMRALRAFLPDAEIVACDIDRDGVDFCAAQFGALPVYSEADPSATRLDGQFDLIWVGSLLTHLNAGMFSRFQDLFERHLADNGLLIFTMHGRRALRRFLTDERRPRESRIAVERDWPSGFAYVDDPGRTGYGMAFAHPSWVLDQLHGREGLTLVFYRENGWADQQDAVALIRKPTDFPFGGMMLV